MNVRLLLNTIKYLKSRQILYRIYHILKKRYRALVGFDYPLEKTLNVNLLKLSDFIYKRESYKERNIFEFLNKRKLFKNNIDWNFEDYGRLWVYNLNYFDFLNQKSMKVKEGLRIIYDFISQMNRIRDGLEAYPTSLRGINWIKFLSKNKILDEKINNNLYFQYNILLNNIEYHLLGNHLLENAFSLLFGAYYFRDRTLYEVARKILINELEEQILSDGGHFEQSPMYHQILLDRLLDSINLLKNNNWIGAELLEFLINIAKLMLGWLEQITFSNGNIPLFNDSAFGIAPTTLELLEYAKRLGIESKSVNLGESGYRLIRKNKYEVAVDIANVKASYIPGHTHADTFTFELYINCKPIIVDTGVSTYESGERRLYERSTKAHNTVEINNTSSSEIWGSFRLGERAKVKILRDSENCIEAIHDGYYRKFKTFHKRKFLFRETSVVIMDELLGNKSVDAKFYLHLHPDLQVKLIDNKISINDGCAIIKFHSSEKINIEECFIAQGFNDLKKSIFIEVPFREKIRCLIEIKN